MSNRLLCEDAIAATGGSTPFSLVGLVFPELDLYPAIFHGLVGGLVVQGLCRYG